MFSHGKNAVDRLGNHLQFQSRPKLNLVAMANGRLEFYTPAK